jgi:hypothetical protein
LPNIKIEKTQHPFFSPPRRRICNHSPLPPLPTPPPLMTKFFCHMVLDLTSAPLTNYFNIYFLVYY